MKRGCAGIFYFLFCLCRPALAAPTQAADIVKRSVANTNADWATAPKYDFTERDITTRHGTRTEKTYQVMMIEGSPYNKLIAENNEKLTGARAAAEDRKLR